MTDETPKETSVEEPAAPASAAPEQETPPETVSKADGGASEARIAELVIKELGPRLKQSQKDTIRDRVNSEVGEKLSEFDSVVELLRPHLPEDLDVQGIKRSKFLDELMQQSLDTPEAEPEAPSQAEAPSPVSEPPGRESEIAAKLEETGLSGTEPELTEYAEENKGKPWYQVGQGWMDLADSITARQAGNSAGVVPPQGQVSNPDLEQAFRKELNDLLYPKDAEGNPKWGTRRNMNQLRQLQGKYRELGLKDEDMDAGGAQPNWQGHRLGDGPPPSR